MLVKMLKKAQYKHEAQEGECELPDHIAKVWINAGLCEPVKKVNKVSPVEETAVANPVEEVKEVKPKRKRRTKKKAE